LKKNCQIWSLSYNYFKPKKLFLSCLRIFELHHLNHFKASLFQPTNTFGKLSQTLYSFACCDVLWNFWSIINVFTCLFMLCFMQKKWLWLTLLKPMMHNAHRWHGLYSCVVTPIEPTCVFSMFVEIYISNVKGPSPSTPYLRTYCTLHE
jgi:hypothetical protein